MRFFLSGVVVCVFLVGFSASPADAQEAKQTEPHANVKKASVAFRIGVSLWLREERFNDLLALFEKHKGVTDEITFFHSTTHAPLKLDEVRRRAAILKIRMAAARRLGYSTGINILTSMGHHEEALAMSISPQDFTPVTDSYGNVSRGSFCPNDPRLREYVRQIYETVTDAEPDYIWIDDDVRLAGHLPVSLTCFCDNCLDIFSKETGSKQMGNAKKTGKNYTRESLRKAFVTGSVEQRIELRKAWLQHNRDTIARLFELIETTVHKKSPGLPLGFMTGDRFYEGYDFARWAEVLAGSQKAPVRWRPGGGFYTDLSTPGLAGKSHDIGRQISVLPPQVVTIQSEIENFPYQRFRKSAHITAVEAASHMAAGCTGVAFNVLTMNDEPLDEFDSMVARLHRSRKFYDLMAEKLGRRPLAGIWPAWNENSAATCGGGGGSWSAYGGFLQGLAPRILELGLPATYSPHHAPVIMLGGDNVSAFSDVEVREMLAKGVYMDAAAAAILHKRGFRDLIGFDLGPVFQVDCIEELTAHPLNGPLAGRQRDARQSFNKWPAQSLKPIDDKGQTLSRVVDYEDREVAPCTMGVYENRLGGRVCIAGYFPWTFQGNLSRSSQMKSVMRWLSKDSLPAYVASYHKVNLWVRQPVDGQVALALTNSSFDPAEDLTLMLLTYSDKLTVYDMDGRPTSVTASGNNGPYRKFVLSTVGPWQVRLIATE